MAGNPGHIFLRNMMETEVEILKENEATERKSQSDGVAYVKPLTRLFAFQIDYSVVLIFALFLLGIEYLLKSRGIWNAFIPNIFLLVFTAFYGSYFVLMNSSKSKGTFGKQFFKIKVTDTKGRRLSQLESTIHLLSSIGLTLFFCISWFKAKKTRKYKTLHDSLSGVVVIRKKEDVIEKQKYRIAAICAMILSIGLTISTVNRFIHIQMMEWQNNMSLKMALEEILFKNKPVFDYVENNIKQKKGFPRSLHASILPSKKDQTYYIFTYAANQQRIIINVRVSGKKATLVMEPTVTKDMNVRWYCGSTGFEQSDLPDVCHAYDKKY